MNKEKGNIYTPSLIVNKMLNRMLFSCPIMVGKHFMDNSCGTGNFLVEIVKRYIREAQYMPNDEIKESLLEHIHGIDNDAEAVEICKSRLNKVLEECGINWHKMDWDIRCENALTCHEYDGKMDYVVGNPPYIRIHNVDNATRDLLKTFDFAKAGDSDTYLAFYEVGIKMLNETGVLFYISPSSWFTSASGKEFRKFIIENNYLTYIKDYGHEQVFDGVQTYCAICGIDKSNEERKFFYEYNGMSYAISYDDAIIKDKLYFGTKKNLKKLRDIIESEGERKYRVKNGFATLADNLFISKEKVENVVAKTPFDKYIVKLIKEKKSDIDKEFNLIPVIKASTGNVHSCFYPYDEKGNPIEFNNLNKNAQDKLLSVKEKLEKRTYDNKGNGGKWWLFGRSQGVNDTYSQKYAINCVIKSKDDIKIISAPPGTGVYGGIYILTDEPLENLASKLKNNDFFRYVMMLKKYKSGGYYTFSAKDLESYLNYEV